MTTSVTRPCYSTQHLNTRPARPRPRPIFRSDTGLVLRPTISGHIAVYRWLFLRQKSYSLSWRWGPWVNWRAVECCASSREWCSCPWWCPAAAAVCSVSCVTRMSSTTQWSTSARSAVTSATSVGRRSQSPSASETARVSDYQGCRSGFFKLGFRVF